MIRRLLGFAHVMDFDSIEDVSLRARCERGALSMARTLLTHPGRFGSINAVLDAVPRAVPQAAP
jgi:5-methylthioribose kinase